MLISVMPGCMATAIFACDWIVALHNPGYAEGCGASRYGRREALTKAGFTKPVAKVWDLGP